MPSRIKVKIEGTAPLLHHRYPIEGAQDEGKAKKATASLEDYRLEAERSLYKDDNGVPFQPANHIEGTLVEAAKQFKMKGARGRNFGKLFKAIIAIEPIEIPLMSQSGWKPDARVVVNPTTRGRVLRYRPMFKDWTCEFIIVCLDESVQSDLIKQILDHAGAMVGIGDYRPKFGRFKVVEFAEEK